MNLMQTRLASFLFLASLFSLAGTGIVSAQSPLAEQLLEEPLAQLARDAEKFGDPNRGAIAFYLPTMNCSKCHATDASAARLGPNLAEKRAVDWSHLAESVLQPSAKINEGFRSAQVLMDDGKVISGVLIEDTEDALSLGLVETPGAPATIQKSQIEDWQLLKTSTMPEGLVSQLGNRQQFLDLVSYLAAIAEGGQVVADQLQPRIAAIAPLPEYESRVDHAALIKGLGKDAFQRGEEIYRLQCASCHGTVEAEGSMPTSLRFASGTFRHGADPLTMYRTLTHGFGMMNPQRSLVPRQKYEVIHYLREHFLRPHNPSQLTPITESYLASLPKGDTLGPEPVNTRPWSAMDYGPSLNNTLEVSRDGSNIAQKGIIVRLDDGAGGVESGSHWMLYEHDTLRVAAAWTGEFIDYEGIHFNGAHQRHPSLTGDVVFANPTAPGFARPNSSEKTDSIAQRFEEDRVVGRDGKHYGPMPSDWARFEGLFRFGKQTILKYRVGESQMLESPSLMFSEKKPVFIRNFEIGKRDQEIILQVAAVDGVLQMENNLAVVLPRQNESSESSAKGEANSVQRQPMNFSGENFYQLDGDGFDMFGEDYSIAARIKTRSDGTIFAKTRDQSDWISQGVSLFIRDGKPTLDVGWVGAVEAKRKINDGKFHDLVMTWSDGEVAFFIDGRPAGGGRLRPESSLDQSVVRMGRTNENFPATSNFEGTIDDLRFYQRKLNQAEASNLAEVEEKGLKGRWNHQTDLALTAFDTEKELPIAKLAAGKSARKVPSGLIAAVVGVPGSEWIFEQGQLRLRIPAGDPVNFSLGIAGIESVEQKVGLIPSLERIRPQPLTPFTQGGPAVYPEVLNAKLIRGKEQGPFAVDVFERPKDNPWNCRLRLTGVDFMPDPNVAVVTTWDGSVWMVTGVASDEDSADVKWRRFATGLFQPLGVKVIDGVPYVICRDQIVALHDLNRDGEADWYKNFNSDHQVTEHFHEFAAGLQTDDEGNFYYSKCACHAKKAIVPQHGTLLKVSADGSTTEILANGFRAANGVCLNPDGTFFVTDQEGHWTPKNRINHVRRGGFYGNYLGYHDDLSTADDAMEQPLCWITNEFDRSPAELIWVTSDKWGPLKGSLLNFSYGYGQIYVVPHEVVDGQTQGGMARLPIQPFPTGIMRGRFHPVDGQLYCCGMFAWAGNQTQPGGFYRVRYTGEAVNVPVAMKVSKGQIELSMTDALGDSATDVSNYQVEVWDLKRTANYGSKHLNVRKWKIDSASLSSDGKKVTLSIEELEPTWGMRLNYSLTGREGEAIRGELHGSIHRVED